MDQVSSFPGQACPALTTHHVVRQETARGICLLPMRAETLKLALNDSLRTDVAPKRTGFIFILHPQGTQIFFATPAAHYAFLACVTH